MIPVNKTGQRRRIEPARVPGPHRRKRSARRRPAARCPQWRPDARPQPGKRWIEAPLALFGLVLISPLLLLIAIAIRVESPGPALFRQVRSGRDRQPFVILKFRTMTAPAGFGPAGEKATAAPTPDQRFSERLAEIQTGADGPRVTRLGRLLRRTALDELPQLINVLRGDMALVGPRPHMPALDELFRPGLPGVIDRYAVTPGMTGLAQVNGAAGETPDHDAMRRRLDADVTYIERWSPLLDIHILLATLRLAPVPQPLPPGPRHKAAAASRQRDRRNRPGGGGRTDLPRNRATMLNGLWPRLFIARRALP